MCKNFEVMLTLESIVNSVRLSLSDTSNPTFRGLCNIACANMASVLNDTFGDTCEARLIHGELAHKYHIPSIYWREEHTILEVSIDDKVYYVDPTLSQFVPLIGLDVLNKLTGSDNGLMNVDGMYYIGNSPPGYMILDYDNYVISFWDTMWEKLIEFVEYKLRGKICDMYRRLTRCL